MSNDNIILLIFGLIFLIYVDCVNFVGMMVDTLTLNIYLVSYYISVQFKSMNIFDNGSFEACLCFTNTSIFVYCIYLLQNTRQLVFNILRLRWNQASTTRDMQIINWHLLFIFRNSAAPPCIVD